MKEKIIGHGESVCPRCGLSVYIEEYNKIGGRPEGDYTRYTCVKCGELTYDEDELLSE